MTKKCIGCGESKNISVFAKSKAYANGVGSYCVECNRKRVAEYQRSPAGKAALKRYFSSPKGREARRRFRETEKSIEAERRYAASPARKASRRKFRWRVVYGLSETAYNKILAAQNGVCAICKEPPLGQYLSVDHDHNTGEVRGLLHSHCNFILGHARDNPHLLTRAADYLKQPIRITALLEIL